MGLGMLEHFIEMVDEVEDGLIFGLMEGLGEPNGVEMRVLCMDMAKPVEIAKRDSGQADVRKDKPGEGVGKGQEGPGFRRRDLEEIDGLSLVVDYLVVLTDQEVHVVMGGRREGWDDIRLGR